MRTFLTGGAGYIGSHTLLQLRKQQHDVLVYDNFSNSLPKVLERVKQLSNRSFSIVEGDIRDKNHLLRAFHDFRPEAVVHFAGMNAAWRIHRKASYLHKMLQET